MNAGTRALADATLLAVQRRVASPLRHEMAGALLVPRMRLQMLRRQARAGAPAADVWQAKIDEVIAALDEVQCAQRSAMAWFEQKDEGALALGDALAQVASALGLAAGERGLRIDWRGGSGAQASHPAQPLGLMLYAGFFHVLDHAPAGSTVAVDCVATATDADVRWRFEPEAASGGAGSPPPPAADPAEVLEGDGVSALCARYGARFASRADGANLMLGPGGA